MADAARHRSCANDSWSCAIGPMPDRTPSAISYTTLHGLGPSHTHGSCLADLSRPCPPGYPFASRVTQHSFARRGGHSYPTAGRATPSLDGGAMGGTRLAGAPPTLVCPTTISPLIITPRMSAGAVLAERLGRLRPCTPSANMSSPGALCARSPPPFGTATRLAPWCPHEAFPSYPRAGGNGACRSARRSRLAAGPKWPTPMPSRTRRTLVVWAHPQARRGRD